MNWKVKLSLLIGFLLATNVLAATLHALDNIEQAAYEYALNQARMEHDNPQIIIQSLDPRLRLQACDSALEVYRRNAKSTIGNQTIGVKCHSPVAWTVYVPIKVKVFKEVVVTNRPLTANYIITKNDIKIKTWDIGLLRQAYGTDLGKFIGQQLKHAVSKGTVLSINSVKAQKIIRRGEQIILVASVGAMEVRMNGTALADAQLGQRIKVRNNSSKRVVEGIVEAPGIVKVVM